MSGDASTSAQDQNVESNDVSATPDVDAGTPIDPVVEETPTLDTEIDPANRLQQLLEAVRWIDFRVQRGSFLHNRINRGAGIDVRSRGNVVGFDVLILR